VRAVVDTNVVAYFLLGTQPFIRETRRFWRAVGEPIAPSLWEAELANVVWMAVRSGILPPDEASKRLDLAARLGIHSVPSRTLWQGALFRSVESGVAVYDTLFIELAGRERLPLATFDRRMLNAFPDIAKRPGDLFRK
jgi:predicted nucleic acid-binding protein